MSPTIPRWVILLLGVGLIGFGIASSLGWLQDPSLTRADYFGTIDVSVEDARTYRAVPFEWNVASQSATHKGMDTAYVRIDSNGEVSVLCGYLKLENQGTSLRAARWLSEARLNVGDLKISALFIAPADKAPGAGLNAGCARLQPGVKPASDAPLILDGPQVRE
jgi:hypothetical protein